MKKILLASVAVFAASLSLHAADELRDNVGIGLGTMLFEGHNGLVSQISAATTNGTSGNQTFAITSGTSAAKPYDGFFAQHRIINQFVRDNMDTLARDMAAGAGESVDTLAELMNIPAAKRADFAKTLQAHFGEIYTSSTVTHTDVVARLETIAAAV